MTEFSTIYLFSKMMMAYFLIFAAAASAVASPPSAELRKLPVSELRAMLDARGVECKACVEKKHWVARVRKTWKRPIVKKAGGNGARRKRRKTKPKGAAERRTAGLEVQDDGHGGYTLPKETFMEQLGANPDMDRGMMEQLWEQFSAQLESGTISLDPAKNKGVKQTIDMQGRGKKKKRSRSRKGAAAGGGEEEEEELSSLEYLLRSLLEEGSLFHFVLYTWIGRGLYLIVFLAFASSGCRRCKRDGPLRCLCPIVKVCDWCCGVGVGGEGDGGEGSEMDGDGAIGGKMKKKKTS